MEGQKKARRCECLDRPGRDEMSESQVMEWQKVYDHFGWCIETTFLLLIVGFFVLGAWELGKLGFRKLGSIFRFKDWREGKIFVLEDICIYSLVLIFNFSADYIHNFFSLARFTEPVARPVSFGFGQIFVFVVFGALLLRKLKQLRFYR